MEILERVSGFRGSWADVTAQAEALFGDEGRQVALLLRCGGMGSKRLLEAQIDEAGFDFAAVLDWADKPYSSEGLKSAAAAMAAAIASEINSDATASVNLA